MTKSADKNKNTLIIRIPDLPDRLKRETESVIERVTNVSREHTKLDHTDSPSIIYHYTDDRGLHGILQSGELWFTQIFDLNDPSEMQHGFSIGHRLLLSALPDAATTARETITTVDRVTSMDNLKFYTCSFSTDKDELGQWRAYADDGKGYAVGFDARSMVDSNDLSLFAVRYDDKSLTEKLKRVIAAAMPFIKKYGATASPSPEADALTVVLASLSSSLMMTSSLYKHEDYKSENEFRLLLKHVSKYTPVFRMRPYFLVKYIKYPFRTHHPIKEIVVGPSTAETSRQFAHDCLKAYYNDKDVAITQSSIPYRSTR